jgi:ketosteroid isomerase-like protein
MRLAAAALAALLLSGCVHVQAAPPPAPPPRPDPVADEAAIRARLGLWVEQYNAGDYPAAATIWAPDLVGWMGGGPDDTYERQQEAAGRAPPADPPRFSLTVNEVLVDGDLAVVRATWEEQAKGKVTVYKSFEVWRRQPDGLWKIARWIDAGPEPVPIASPPRP